MAAVAFDPLGVELVAEALVPDGDLAVRGKVKSEEPEYAGGGADGICGKFLVKHWVGLYAFGSELSLILAAEPGLRMARDPRGIQQPAQQRTPRPWGSADQVRASPLRIRCGRRTHGAIEARAGRRSNGITSFGGTEKAEFNSGKPPEQAGKADQQSWQDSPGGDRASARRAGRPCCRWRREAHQQGREHQSELVKCLPRAGSHRPPAPGSIQPARIGT